MWYDAITFDLISKNFWIFGRHSGILIFQLPFHMPYQRSSAETKERKRNKNCLSTEKGLCFDRSDTPTNQSSTHVKAAELQLLG